MLIATQFPAQWFSIRGDFAPRWHLEMSREIFGCHNLGRELLTYAQDSPQQRIIQPNVSIVPSWEATSINM